MCECVWVQDFFFFLHSIPCPAYRIVSRGVNMSGCRKILLCTPFSVLLPVYRIVSTGVNVSGCRKILLYTPFSVLYTELSVQV